MGIKIIKKAVNTALQKELDDINKFLSEQSSLPEFLLSEMANYKEMKAITDEHFNVEMNYEDVISDVNNIANSMQVLGIGKNDFVSFFSENNGRHFSFNQGTMKVGACSVLRGIASPVEELEYILNHSESKALVLSDYKILEKLIGVIDQNKFLKFVVVVFEKGKPAECKIPVYSYEKFIDLGKGHDFKNPEINLSDNAVMLYTSGTTGMPKGVLLSHKNLLSQMLPIKDGLDIKPGEKSLQILPVWHAYEMTTQTLFFATGFHLHFTTLPKLKTDLLKYDIDIFMSVPRIWEALRLGIYQKLKQESKLGYLLFDFAVKTSVTYKIHKMYSEKRTPNKTTGYNYFSRAYHKIVRTFIKPLHVLFTNTIYDKIKNLAGLNFRASFSGGGALSLKDELFYDAIGVNIRTGYGLTETSPDLTLRHAQDKNYLCSVGKPIKGTEIKIVDPETRQELGIFHKGIVYVRGPQVMKGYYKDPEATEKIIDKEGWLNTGDLGWLTADNHLVLVGRIKETIVLSNGENIEPVPIEEVCLQSQYIEQIILVGQDESSIGALVVPSQEALEKCGVALKDLSKGSTLSIKNPNLHELIKKEINAHIKMKPNLKPVERIKNFEILKDSFKQENGLLSQTGKTKRNQIFEVYNDIISKMFLEK